MKKKILITGSTDGIGLATARMLLEDGHHVLIHGRNPTKMAQIEVELSAIHSGGSVESFIADLSSLQAVDELAAAVSKDHKQLDALINNAGILRSPKPILDNGIDERFMVNALAPYRLTTQLLPLLGTTGRVINLSSAAQAPVDIKAMAGEIKLDDMSAYAQSKLAITMWSIDMAKRKNAPVVIAINPGSMLGTKMVKEGLGVDGGDIKIGARILFQATLDDQFSTASGQYFDNDIGQFGSPHIDALNPAKRTSIVRAIETIVETQT